MSLFDGFHINWTLSSGYTQVKIKIYRLDWTDKGVFGHLVGSNGFECVTLERSDTLIPEGTYKASFYDSPANKMKVLLLDVPGRSYIEVHPADYQNQLKGCIALAARRQKINNTDPDGFASDANKATFTRFMDSLKGANDITIEVL